MKAHGVLGLVSNAQRLVAQDAPLCFKHVAKEQSLFCSAAAVVTLAAEGINAAKGRLQFLCGNESSVETCDSLLQLLRLLASGDRLSE